MYFPNHTIQLLGCLCKQWVSSFFYLLVQFCSVVFRYKLKKKNCFAFNQQFLETNQYLILFS